MVSAGTTTDAFLNHNPLPMPWPSLRGALATTDEARRAMRSGIRISVLAAHPISPPTTSQMMMFIICVILNASDGQYSSRANASVRRRTIERSRGAWPLCRVGVVRAKSISHPGGGRSYRSSAVRNHIPVEGLMRVAALGLGLRQRSVSVSQERLGVLTVIGVHADADAHRSI